MPYYYLIIALTFIGFVALAAILLVPVYLFLRREEEIASHWTDETIAHARSERESEERDDAVEAGADSFERERPDPERQEQRAAS